MKIRRVNFSPDEYLAGTVRLSPVERGCYWTVCCLIYSHGGPIDDDPEWLAKACNCHGNTWLAVRRRLVDLGKLIVLPPTRGQPCGRLDNPRAARELNAAENRVKLSRKGSDSSAKRRRKARQKTRELLKSNGLAPASARVTRRAIKSHESLTIKDSESDARARRDREAPRARDESLRPVAETLAQLAKKHRTRKP
jgi:uncharacterized protein YdaU (DUF1376 family)